MTEQYGGERQQRDMVEQHIRGRWQRKTVEKGDGRARQQREMAARDKIAEQEERADQDNLMVKNRQSRQHG